MDKDTDKDTSKDNVKDKEKDKNKVMDWDTNLKMELELEYFCKIDIRR
jgi:hypothetical protein